MSLFEPTDEPRLFPNPNCDSYSGIVFAKSCRESGVHPKISVYPRELLPSLGGSLAHC